MSASNLPILKCGLLWLRLSLVYLLIGLAIGVYMGATQVYGLRPIHVHVNLLGWALAAVAGLTYCFLPQAGDSKWGKAHFWLHQIGVPVMLISLYFVLMERTAFVPGLLVGEVLVVGSVICYLVNLIVNVNASD